MTDNPNRLEAFTMDGVAYKGRPVLVQEMRRHLAECTVTGKVEPPGAEKLHDTIKAQNKAVETLRLAGTEMAKTIEAQETKIAELRAGGDSGKAKTPKSDSGKPPKVPKPKKG